ncbi:TPA: hypothetical protein N0F65_012091 [Lagenidium giganteum]|uniref:Ribosomal protein L32 n=1 Tax=Lagenidium giganteum TaxID=4803 RepID=A0AAV2YWL4_9STRA|nr:TPA: hypothetical protein N0F65_012091 [Lagenidium giganteum]
MSFEKRSKLARRSIKASGTANS